MTVCKVYGIAGFEMTEEKDMAKVTFDYSKASKFISDDEVVAMKKIAEDAKEVLVNKSGAGNDFLGWIDLPVDYDKDEFARIKAAAKKIQSDSEVLVVIGIGGSYLGARAAIAFLDMVSITMYQKKSEKHLKFTMQEIALALHT